MSLKDLQEQVILSRDDYVTLEGTGQLTKNGETIYFEPTENVYIVPEVQATATNPGLVCVDPELAFNSKNPVENGVITQALSECVKEKIYDIDVNYELGSSYYYAVRLGDAIANMPVGTTKIVFHFIDSTSDGCPICTIYPFQNNTTASVQSYGSSELAGSALSVLVKDSYFILESTMYACRGNATPLNYLQLQSTGSIQGSGSITYSPTYDGKYSTTLILTSTEATFYNDGFKYFILNGGMYNSYHSGFYAPTSAGITGCFLASTGSPTSSPAWFYSSESGSSSLSVSDSGSYNVNCSASSYANRYITNNFNNIYIALTNLNSGYCREITIRVAVNSTGYTYNITPINSTSSTTTRTYHKLSSSWNNMPPLAVGDYIIYRAKVMSTSLVFWDREVYKASL